MAVFANETSSSDAICVSFMMNADLRVDYVVIVVLLVVFLLFLESVLDVTECVQTVLQRSEWS
jgi:hypothetical protein